MINHQLIKNFLVLLSTNLFLGFIAILSVAAVHVYLLDVEVGIISGIMTLVLYVLLHTIYVFIVYMYATRR